MNSMLKVIIFDVGGVLYKKTYYGYYRQPFNHFSKQLKISKDAVRDAFLASDDRAMTGRENAEKFIERVSKFLGKELVLSDFMKLLNDRTKNIDPRMLRLTKKLKRNYKVIVLSDDIKDASKPMRKKLRKYYHQLYFSCDLGVRKPDKRIFRIVINKLHTKPEECLFIDDKPENVKSAKSVGIHAVQFKNYSKLLNDLKNHGGEI